MSELLTLTRPDDWHLHLRDGAALACTVPPSARVFARAVVMPNLTPPVTSVASALAYRERILAAVPAGVSFEPLMALYLTDRSDPAELRAAAADPRLIGAKLYPAGATTNSDAGVTSVERIEDALAAMQEADLPLLVHGETVDPAVDVFDREAVFIERTLGPLCERFPRLRVVFEHVTTAEAVAFVESARPGVAATLTPQHLLMNRDDLLAGGLRPHNYCLPVLKRRAHQLALQRAALSGNPRFFLGSDSAPHARARKESACGCAGCFSAPAALELYAQFFDAAGALARLEPFAAHHGADFYRRPRNPRRLTLERRPWTVPERLDFAGPAGHAGAGDIVPYWAGRELAWRVTG